MKRVYTAESIIQVTHVRNLLAAEGIATEIRNERLGSVIGEIPFLECAPQIWIRHALDEARARELIEQLRTPVAGEPWTCRQCGEVLEPQFAQCWNCGAPR